MLEALLIVGLIVGWVVSVPFMARSFYEPGDELFGGALPVAIAVLTGWAWPVFLFFAAVWRLSRWLAPKILRAGEGRETPQ